VNVEPNSSYEKRVPLGAWMMIDQLPPSITDEELQTYLASRGMWVPLENISVRQYPEYAVAKISVPNDVVGALVDWAIDKTPVQEGFVPRVKVWQQNKGRR